MNDQCHVCPVCGQVVPAAESDEAPMATIFGRVEPLADRDPTAPHDEPPMMAGG